MKRLVCVLLSQLAAATALLAAAPSLRILLPERTRLLQGQQIDLVLEVRNAAAVSGLRVTAGAEDYTSRFGAAAAAQLDCDASSDWVIRADLQSFTTTGKITFTASASADGQTVTDSREIEVRPFSPPVDGIRRNIILFIGDAMGTSYRDAARLVARAIVDANGKNSFREGFFDDLLEMDKMPVSGMVMTYGTDSIVPDSANTATAWATGNKSYLYALNALADGTDCRWRFNNAANLANFAYISDNPRVESLWQYLKRVAGYRAGIVSTADITDATPAAEGAYSGFRQTRFEVARQYLENPMLQGKPAFEVLLGGGKDQFMGSVRADKRDLIQEFQNRGYRLVTTASELRSVSGYSPVLGLFRASPSPRASSTGIRAGTDPNMDVAYDKLGFRRPPSETGANAYASTGGLGSFTDQPMLDLMTQKAIEVLSSSFAGTPFILMVEGASIDKQSHPNSYTGTIWDTIEFDKAVGVARTWAAKRKDTLVLVGADHGQSMNIIGVSNTPDTEYFDSAKKEEVTVNTTRGEQRFTVYGDSYTNARSALPVINSSTGAENNRGAAYMPGTFKPASTAADPYSDTFSAYFGSPGYPLDSRSGYPLNEAPQGKTLRRLAVGFRTGDHTADSVPFTAEGTGAFLFTGYMDLTDIFFRMAAVAAGETAEADKLLEAMQKNTRLPQTIGK